MARGVWERRGSLCGSLEVPAPPFAGPPASPSPAEPLGAGDIDVLEGPPAPLRDSSIPPVDLEDYSPTTSTTSMLQGWEDPTFLQAESARQCQQQERCQQQAGSQHGEEQLAGPSAAAAAAAQRQQVQQLQVQQQQPLASPQRYRGRRDAAEATGGARQAAGARGAQQQAPSAQQLPLAQQQGGECDRTHT